MSDLTCQQMTDCLTFVGRRFRNERIAEYWAGENAVDSGVLTACAPCRATTSTVRPKKCQGWSLNFYGENALRLMPVDVEGRPVSAQLEGHLRVGELSGVQRAVDLGSFAISVQHSTDGHLITRQHCDRANPGQPGSIWHIQLGGLPSERSARPQWEWLDVPRWPALPVDFMLAVEMLVYNFRWAFWDDLRHDAAWQTWVKESEDLVLSPYVKQLNDYYSTRGSNTSWLAVQCNELASL